MKKFFKYWALETWSRATDGPYLVSIQVSNLTDAALLIVYLFLVIVIYSVNIVFSPFIALYYILKYPDLADGIHGGDKEKFDKWFKENFENNL